MSVEISAHLKKLMDQYFPDWQITEKLGEGSYARVYSIGCTSLGDVAALKWISYTEADAITAMQNRGVNPEAIRNYCRHTQRLLENEIRTLDRLSDCPNIVRMNDYHTVENEDGSFDMLIRMELLTPLHRRVPLMRIKDVLSMGKDICGALVACETENIVHRDIKPENIFCDKSGHYKLGDFGVATSLYGDKKAKTQRGTPLYMAPEVYENKPYDGRVDICSLGLVLYECLNGCLPPFMDVFGESVTPEKENEALLKRMSDEEDMPVPTQADADLTEIVLKACSFDPDDRYQSAREMLDALNALGERPEYEEKLVLYTSGNAEPEKPQPDPSETIRGLSRHTLELTQRVENGNVVNTDKPVEDEDEELPQEEQKEKKKEKENPFELQRIKRKKTIKKVIIISSLIIALGLIILAIVLICVNKASYSGLEVKQNGTQSFIEWDNGGSGPWNVKIKISGSVVEQVSADKRKVTLPLAPGYTYTVDVDEKIKKEYNADEMPAYKGELNLRWLRLCSYTVQAEKELRDQSTTECTVIEGNPLIGQPGQTGYLLKGCAELPAGKTIEIICFMISDNGMEMTTVTVEGTDDGFRYFYIPLNEFIRNECLDSDRITIKLYTNEMLLYNKSAEIS